MRWVNRIAAAVLLLAVVAGPPLLAVLWMSQSPPPTTAAFAAWLEQPVTAGSIIAGCVFVAAAAWMLLLYHLACRGWHWLRRLRLPTPAQVTAGSMAGVAALTLPGAVAPAEASPQPSATAPASEKAGGISLPGGGWIPYRTALAVTGASALIWLHRRRHYRPGPPRADGHTDDPDLQPLPDTVQAITTEPGVPTQVTLERPPAGVLTLTGPGAAAAARGLLVTAALEAAHHGKPTHHVRIDAATLSRLLPGVDPDPLAAFGIHVAETPTPDDWTVVSLSASDHVGGTEWQVAADGTITAATQPRRICVLGEQSGADLIALARQLRDGTSPEPTRGRPALSLAGGGRGAPGRLEIIGGCRLTINGKEVRLRRSAGLQILAYLATHGGAATSAELTHACWPGLSAASIAQRLHTTVSDLRRQLRPHLTDEPIHRSDGHYRLNADIIDTDLQAWREAIAAAAIAPDVEARVHACRHVVQLYTGEVAAGHQWLWLIPIREAVRRDVIDAYAVLADHAEPEQAIELLQQALAIEPHNEELSKRATHARNCSNSRAQEHPR